MVRTKSNLYKSSGICQLRSLESSCICLKAYGTARLSMEDGSARDVGSQQVRGKPWQAVPTEAGLCWATRCYSGHSWSI